jgi:parallel beta-helix repeat protein
VQNNCVHTDDLVTFKINWSANGHNDTNVKIIDYLPSDLDYYSSEPPVDDYNSTIKKYIWELGTLTGTEYGTFKITARVKSLSCPCGKLTNTACLEGDTYLSEATADVNACSWQAGIVYVDQNANGIESGANWDDAYTDLQEAFAAGQDCEGFKAVWIAAGTYTGIPDNNGVSFELVDGVSLFGHFAGSEASPDERDFTNSDNETILDGLIDPDSDGRVSCIIKGQSIDNVIIDGLTIQKAGYDGINLDDCNVIVQKCTLTDNVYHGVFNYNGALTINGSVIKNNFYYGIMLSYGSSATIINNWIYNNSNYGIVLGDSVSATTIRNNTIFGNGSYGVKSYSADPIIQNCIIRGNTSGDFDGTLNNVNYCYLQNAHSGYRNFVADPCFVNPNSPYDLHIKWNSPCRNKGDSNGIPPDETDIDGEGRINGIVDIGADEYYRSPDFNKNGIVDFKDFAVLALTWLKGAGNGGFNEICDLADDNIINVGDLELFCQNWLMQSEGVQSLMLGGGGAEKMKIMMEDIMEVGLQPMMETQTPAIYLTCDTNSPDPNTEVTVYVYTDTPLFVLDVYATVAGDANITTAMGSYDCTDYGWDPGWNWNPYIDEPNGIVEFGGISWTAVANGTVGYFKFIYHSGKVSVSFDQECSIAFGYGSSCPSVPFSTDALIFGRDPNE